MCRQPWLPLGWIRPHQDSRQALLIYERLIYYYLPSDLAHVHIPYSRHSSETHTGSAWPWGHAQPFLLLHNQPCPTWAARTPSTGSTSAPGCRERRMQLEKSAQGGNKMAEKHCSRVRHAAEGTSKNLPLPPGKEFSTLQEKKKRELFPSDRLHGKERKERECQSVNLFIHQARKDWRVTSESKSKFIQTQLCPIWSSSDNLAILTQIL